jgi:hypothetical protein
MEGSLEQLQASMHADLMAGRPLELEALNGAVVRLGCRAGVSTPINQLIYAMLKPFAGGPSPGVTSSGRLKSAAPASLLDHLSL